MGALADAGSASPSPHGVGSTPAHVVIGGGLAGLVVARELLAAGRSVTLLESGDRPGGKLRAEGVAGVSVDVGAEAMLNRRPEGVTLARELGLDLEHPLPSTSRIWIDGSLRRLPRSLMGVPLDVDDLAGSGVLSPAGVDRVRGAGTVGPLLLGEHDDVDVRTLVEAHYGPEVVDLLVEPLLGGVHAGDASRLSARATVPQVIDLLAGRWNAQATLAATPGVPVFAGVSGGMARLAEALALDVGARGGRIVVNCDATAVRRAGDGSWRVETGGGGRGVSVGRFEAESVVVATPAPSAARLLAEAAPVAAAELAQVEYASMAVVTMAVPMAQVEAMQAQQMSGFLVPPVQRRDVKAATFSFAKWEWVRSAGAERGVALLRASLGRHGDAAVVQRDDAELVALSVADIERATGARLTPVDAHVQRWSQGLPQYWVGHEERMSRARAALPDGVTLTGAASGGLGIPAVIASARAAAASLLDTRIVP